MEKIKLERLKEVLSVPSYSGNESRMIKYLKGVLTSKGYEHTVDTQGNIFVTKGISESYPLFIAHTDTVHTVNENLRIDEYTKNGDGHVNKLALTGYDVETGQPLGCGGDDKCGIYLALEMLDTYENVKAAFFVSEEIGCIGSRGAVRTNPDFFKNVGYAIQYDSPEGNSLSSTLMGKYLFESSDVFTNKVSAIIREHGLTKWANHPYTDIWPLLDEFDFCCLNLAAGYYRYHTKNEYVIVDDVQNGYNLGLRLVEILGETKYIRPNKEYSYRDSKPVKSTPYNYNKVNKKPLLLSETTVSNEDKKRMDQLQSVSLHSWSDDDWDFYELYMEKKWSSKENDDNGLGINFMY